MVDGIVGGIEDMMFVEMEVDGIRVVVEVAALFDLIGILFIVVVYSYDICICYIEV